MTGPPHIALKLPPAAPSTQPHLQGACCWWLPAHTPGPAQPRLRPPSWSGTTEPGSAAVAPADTCAWCSCCPAARLCPLLLTQQRKAYH